MNFIPLPLNYRYKLDRHYIFRYVLSFLVLDLKSSVKRESIIKPLSSFEIIAL